MSVATSVGAGGTAGWALWNDRRGRLSAVRVATLLVLVWPLLLAVFDASRDNLTGRPLNELIHRAGWWALMFLLVSLAITPFRRSLRFGRLVDLRRMIGVASFCYAGLHLSLYVVDQNGNLLRVAVEIVSRIYLIIGLLALVGLAVLAATSTDRAVRRMGGSSWRRLHLLAYAITLLAFVHFFQQTKADLTVPTLYAGLFAWLMGYRLLARWRGEGTIGPVSLGLLAIGTGLLVLLGEAAGIAWQFGQPISAFLDSRFILDSTIRPGWIVMAAGLAVAVVDAVRGWTGRSAVPATRRAA